ARAVRLLGARVTDGPLRLLARRLPVQAGGKDDGGPDAVRHRPDRRRAVPAVLVLGCADRRAIARDPRLRPVAGRASRNRRVARRARPKPTAVGRTSAGWP